jgi:DNA-binding NtrC family response regulator
MHRVHILPGDVLRIGAVIVVLQRKGRASHTELKAVSDPVPARPPVLVDPEMRRAYELVSRAAASDISVLILGETGVGKEITAEALHCASPRAQGPFLRLNCAALPESLLESELFGHERGAFTGAHATKVGLLEATDGGTVFLDEIGELPLGTQAKLLRVLEERTVTRVGATKPRRIDVRFVTATNRDLSREVRAGGFRGDLYYRISGLVVRVPALRQRPTEIEPLARHFLQEFCARSGQPVPELLDRAIERLKAYEWPGNVRELKNVMERAALLANQGVITEEEILLELAHGADELNDVDDFDSDTAVFHAPDPSLGERGERDRIVRALELCGGNQTRAAKMLGVSRRTLINRLEQFNLPRPKKG